MGLFGLFGRSNSGGLFHGITKNTKKSKIYKILQSVAFAGIFVVAALFVFGIMNIIPFSSTLFTLIIKILILKNEWRNKKWN